MILCRRDQAKEIYQLGIHRRAQPLKRLQAAYVSFQSRPAVIVAPPSTTSLGGVSSLSAHGGRKVLGVRSSGGLSTSGGLGQGQGQTSYTTSNGKPANQSRLDVFSDEQQQQTQNGQGGGLNGNQHWEDLGTISGNRKENERETTGWKGEKLLMDKRVVMRVAPRTPKLEVFRDGVSGIPTERKALMIFELDS